MDGMKKLAIALETTVDWLTGAGEDDGRTIISIDEAESNGHSKPDAGVSSNTRYSGSRAGAMAELDARAGAGNGEIGRVFALPGPGIETAHRVKAEWVFPTDFTRHALGAEPATTIVLEVIGDSMRPTLEPVDRVLVDVSAVWRNDDAVWLIDDGSPKVKRLRPVRNANPPRVLILSDNPNVPPEEVESDDLRIIGRVCGRVSRM
jgi:hypothetical protein